MLIRRKLPEEDDDNPERWLVSYADFITLLFAFFVVMYAMSSVNQSKYTSLTTSMGSAFIGEKTASAANPVAPKSMIKSQNSLVKPLPMTHMYQEKMRRERENMTRKGIDLSNKLAGLINANKVNVVQNNRGIRIDINDSVLFGSGSATLEGSSTEVIKKIASELNQGENLIQVEGHTDNTPIHTTEFFSNWELSAVRATTIVRLLSAVGIAEDRLSGIGYGAVQPLNNNDSEENKAKNRRVSIMILYETKNSDQSASVISPQK